MLVWIALIAIASGSQSWAGTINWSAQTWTPDSLTHAPFNTGDNIVTFQFFDTNGAMAPAANSPSIVDGPLSNINQDQLYWAMDASARNQMSRLVITFATPVTSLTFRITDIDTGGAISGGVYPNWQDRLIVSAKNGANSVNVIANPTTVPDSFTIDNSYTHTGDTTGGFSSQITADQADVDPDESNGNITLTFGSALTTVTIDYFSGANGPTNPALQLIRIANLTFTSVPEPSTWAMMLVAMACGGLAVQRKRHRAGLPQN